jgi:hypothetical protein
MDRTDIRVHPLLEPLCFDGNYRSQSSRRRLNVEPDALRQRFDIVIPGYKHRLVAADKKGGKPRNRNLPRETTPDNATARPNQK